VLSYPNFPTSVKARAFGIILNDRRRKRSAFDQGMGIDARLLESWRFWSDTNRYWANDKPSHSSSSYRNGVPTAASIRPADAHGCVRHAWVRPAWYALCDTRTHTSLREHTNASIHARSMPTHACTRTFTHNIFNCIRFLFRILFLFSPSLSYSLPFFPTLSYSSFLSHSFSHSPSLFRSLFIYSRSLTNIHTDTNYILKRMY
jgi:hypothetical protein